MRQRLLKPVFQSWITHRLVDTINPVLHFHNQTRVLVDDTRASILAVETLGLLEGEGAVHGVAAVHLVGVLVGEDIDADTTPVTPEGGDGAGGLPVVRVLTVDEVGVVVAVAAITAAAVELLGEEILAELLGTRPPVVHAALLVGEDDAGGDLLTVDVNALTGVRQIESVVESQIGIGVLVPIKVPVGLKGSVSWGSQGWSWIRLDSTGVGVRS
jgi:hypothetical protein